MEGQGIIDIAHYYPVEGQGVAERKQSDAKARQEWTKARKEWTKAAAEGHKNAIENLKKLDEMEEKTTMATPEELVELRRSMATTIKQQNVVWRSKMK